MADSEAKKARMRENTILITAKRNRRTAVTRPFLPSYEPGR